METSNNRALVQTAASGTLVKFCDLFKETIGDHAENRQILSTATSAQMDYDQNSCPRSVRRNIDYSENGTIKGKHTIQSQYWGCMSYTMMVLVVSWLKVGKWNEVFVDMEKGEKVTVHGEMAGEPVTFDSLWTTVTCVLDEEQGIFEVTDAN
mmetsp:Transcript_24010/g.70827  ORF Transcript_24010/g.70827 Transcript_24010/m.70827 type:complete len:152 (-) Transcript_24010:1618-2073(-)